MTKNIKLNLFIKDVYNEKPESQKRKNNQQGDSENVREGLIFTIVVETAVI